MLGQRRSSAKQRLNVSCLLGYWPNMKHLPHVGSMLSRRLRLWLNFEQITMTLVNVSLSQTILIVKKLHSFIPINYCHRTYSKIKGYHKEDGQLSGKWEKTLFTYKILETGKTIIRQKYKNPQEKKQDD